MARALGRSEARSHIFEGNNGVWINIFCSSWSGSVGLFRIKLGRECSRSEEHLRVFLYLGVNNDFLVNRKHTFITLTSAKAGYMAMSMVRC